MSLSYTTITFTCGQTIYIRLEMLKSNHIVEINFHNVESEVLTPVAMKKVSSGI
jgi:hypothetical protein